MPSKTPKKEMLINFVPGEECRIAITVDGKLDEYYQERASDESHVGNIYKGRVTNIEPAIQAAFVDFGLERNGFLHITDLHPMYFPGDAREEFEKVGTKTPRSARPPMQKCLKRGQEVLVQVLKEGIGTKGPTVTSYLSIPGRFIVMMPQMDRLGVSRKVEDDDARREMRDILKELEPPEGFGFIVRTAGIGQTKTDLKRDLAYLSRLWKSIEKRQKQVRVGELYAESDLLIRTIRDVFTKDITRVVIDDVDAAKRARDFFSISMPRSGLQLEYYHDPVPLFHRFDIERQIDDINAREVPLPSGGSLVFDQAEALVAIDINSGKSRAARDAESNAYETNKEAVDEVCRQLKLRDLGGVVVCDFIDMMDSKHRRKIEQQMRDRLKDDRARTRTNPISQFGLLEMTRQRMRGSLKKTLYNECPMCQGLGVIKTPESVVLDAMRKLQLVMLSDKVVSLELMVGPDAAFQLLNRRRDQLVALERRFGKPVMVRVGGRADEATITARDGRGGSVNVDALLGRSAMPKTTDDSFLDVKVAALPDSEAEMKAEEGSEVDAIQASLDEAPDLDLDDEIEDIKAPGLPGGRSKRKRRRRGRGRDEEEGTKTDSTDAARPRDDASDGEGSGDSSEASDDGEGVGKKKRRRRRRRRRSGDEESTAEGNEERAEASSTSDEDAGDTQPSASVKDNKDDQPDTSDAEGDEPPVLTAPHPEWDDIARREAEARAKAAAEGGEKKKRSRSRKKPENNAADELSADEATADAPVENVGGESGDGEAEGGEKKKRRRRRRRSRSSDKDGETAKSEGDGEPSDNVKGDDGGGSSAEPSDGEGKSRPRRPRKKAAKPDTQAKSEPQIVVSSYGNSKLGTKTEPVVKEGA
ncbi:MAG: Rne/Rng family ribonuclease [Planctomycetota bacterium]